jgi:hypothetical protein
LFSNLRVLDIRLFGFSLWVSGLILSGVDKNDKDDGRNDEFLGFFIRQILKKKR